MTDPDHAPEDPADAPTPAEGANDGALRPAVWVTGLIVLVLLLLAVFGLD